MNNNNQGHPRIRVGFCGMLTIMFIELKLLGYINWSWLWVLSPIWIPFTLALSLFFIIMFLIVLFTER